MTDIARDLPLPGFNFENCRRNNLMIQNGFKAPKTTKTGTTIAGIIFKDGVILGADTRATSGNIVADKNCEKIHYLAKNIYCCGAGTAADTKMTTEMVASQLELHRLMTNRTVPVVAAKTLLKQMLFRYQGHIGAHLIVGGVDTTGPYVTSIHAHGSTDTLPYTTMGSGSLAAMAVFENRWTPNMELEDGLKLVRDAIAAGILNDLGSGSNVDLCVITKDGQKMHRNYEETCKKGERLGDYSYKPKTTPVLNMEVISFTEVEVEAMDTH